MDKEDVVHVYSGILLSHKKNKIMPFTATWMQLEMITLVEISQKKTNTLLYHLYVESKYGTNEPVYKTETDLLT